MRSGIAAVLLPSFVLTCLLSPTASCSVGDLDLTGKSCPCVAGYVCDSTANVCTREAPLAPAPAPTPTVPEAPPPDAGPPQAPLVVVSALSSPWQTPNTIRWAWKVDGVAASFRSYELVVADAPDKIDTGAGATVIGSAQKLELGAFDARGGRTAGPVDVWTTTHGHMAGKTYFAKLVARDVNGVASTVMGSAMTSAPATSSRILFDGTTQFTPVPGTFEFRAPAGEEPHYFYRTVCSGGATSCDTYLALRMLGRDLNPDFTPAAFATAFLEARFVGAVASSGFTSVLAIEPFNCTLGRDLCQWGFGGWSQLPGVQPVLQVPLRELENANGKLTHAALQPSGPRIVALALSGKWNADTTVRLYDARIKW